MDIEIIKDNLVIMLLGISGTSDLQELLENNL